MGQEICASFPYSIGSGLPSHLQEPWAALIDSGAVTSIAPSSLAPHVPITPYSGQLVNVNGGEIKIKGQKKVTYVTHMVVTHIAFLIVEDVLNPIIGLDALHQNSVQFHLLQTGKAYLQQRSQKAVLHYHKHHYYASGLALSGYVKSSILKWDDPQYTIFDPQSTSQIIALGVSLWSLWCRKEMSRFTPFLSHFGPFFLSSVPSGPNTVLTYTSYHPDAEQRHTFRDTNFEQR